MAADLPQEKNLPVLFLLMVMTLPLGLPVWGSLIVSDFCLIAFLLVLFGKAWRWRRIGAPAAMDGSAAFFFRPTWFDLLFMVFCSFAFFGREGPVFPGTFFRDLGAICFGFLIFRSTLVFSRHSQSRGAILRRFSMVFSLLLVFLSALAVFRSFGVDGLHSPFFSASGFLLWPFRNPNQLGFLLLGAFPLLLSVISRSPCLRFFMYCLGALVGSSLGSRGAFFLILSQIFLLEMFFSRGDFSMGSSLFKGFLTGCLVMIFVWLSPLPSFQRATGNFEKFPLGLEEIRQKTFAEAFDCISLWGKGMGLGCFKRFHRYEIHNTPLSILVECGMGGALSALFLVAFSLRSAVSGLWQRNERVRRQAFVIILALGCFFCLSFFQNLTRTRMVWFLLGLGASFQPAFLRRMSLPVATGFSSPPAGIVPVQSS